MDPLALATVFSTKKEYVPFTWYSTNKHIPLDGKKLKLSTRDLHERNAKPWTVVDVTQAIHARPRGANNYESRVMVRIQVRNLESHRFAVKLDSGKMIYNLRF